MKLYSQLSKISFLKNRYVTKFLFVAFLGIHIPLIGLVFFVMYLEEKLSPLTVFWTTLALTLIATVFTLLILKKLMAPVLKGSKALIDYKNNRIVPRLPLDYTDEAGVLLQNIQATIQMNQKVWKEKKELLGHLAQDLSQQTHATAEIIRELYNVTQVEIVKKKASEAVKSMNEQLEYVAAFTKLIKEEETIQLEQVRVKKVNLEVILKEVIQRLMPKLKDKNIKIHQNIHVPELPLKVNTSLLQKAFAYLLENAIHSSPVDAKIEVTLEKMHGRLLIYVRDFGIGFEAGQAERIFTKFQTILETDSEHPLGANLYLTRQIVERFGGTIVAESAGINQGATYVIELKLYR